MVQRHPNPREQEILDILSNFFPAVAKMRKYEPDEAARACLKWPSEKRAKEAIQEIGEWLRGLGEEMEALTTKGVLRPVEGKEEEEEEAR